MPTETATTSPRAPREIPVRRLAFDFARVRRHWFGGDAFQSHLLHALSLTFPDGERFFMDSVRHYLDRLDSPALRHEVSRFLAQEAAHGQAHEAFNAWVRSLGLDADSIVAQVRANLAVAPSLPSPKDSARGGLRASSISTAMRGGAALHGRSAAGADGGPGDAHALWLWHAIEETEHKAVAFDTYAAVGGTYRLRAIVMLFTSVSFLANVARFQARARCAALDPRNRTSGRIV